ncbi:MAG: hypothetical protein ABEJ36_04970 [Candidatus Nanosalina sp.]
MSTEADPASQLLDQYQHRSRETLESDLDAQAILEGYVKQHGITDCSEIDSSMPYHAALGRVNDANAEILAITHYLQPVEEDTRHRATGHLNETMDLATALEEQVPEEAELETAGIEVEDGSSLRSASGDKIYPESIHCMVFYDEPDMNAMELKHRMDFDNLVHKSVALDAVKNPALGTAIVISGREDSAMQVDYWPKPVDAEIGDYTDLNWGDPSEI